ASYIAFNSWVTPTAKLLNRQGNPVVAQVDNELSITTQNNDYATILMADGASRVDIGPKTQAAIIGSRAIRIQQGVIFNQVVKDPEDPYEVHTRHGIVQVLGTSFEVQVTDSQTRVRVKEGTVALRNEIGEVM